MEGRKMRERAKCDEEIGLRTNRRGAGPQVRKEGVRIRQERQKRKEDKQK